MPAPTWKETFPPAISIVRMVMQVHVAVVADVPDRAAVGSPAGGFELLDDLHGPDLGRSGQRSRRKRRRQDVEAIPFSGSAPGCRDEVHDVGVALDDHD